MLRIFAYRTVTVVHFTDQNRVSKTVYCIWCVMVCKIDVTKWNAKIALLHASMVITYYIKLFRTGADRYNGILMSLLLAVAETIKQFAVICRSFPAFTERVVFWNYFLNDLSVENTSVFNFYKKKIV